MVLPEKFAKAKLVTPTETEGTIRTFPFGVTAPAAPPIHPEVESQYAIDEIEADKYLRCRFRIVK